MAGGELSWAFHTRYDQWCSVHIASGSEPGSHPDGW